MYIAVIWSPLFIYSHVSVPLKFIKNCIKNCVHCTVSVISHDTIRFGTFENDQQLFQFKCGIMYIESEIKVGEQ